MSELPMDKSTWDKVAKRLGLPPQEKRVVELILKDKQDKEICAAMKIGGPTVQEYLKRSYRRACVNRRLSLVLRIFKEAQGIGRNGDAHPDE